MRGVEPRVPQGGKAEVRGERERQGDDSSVSNLLEEMFCMAKDGFGSSSKRQEVRSPAFGVLEWLWIRHFL